MAYDTSYFEWQKTVGELGGTANLFKFQPYIKETDRVLDFGCGGGFLLKNLACADRLGIDTNPVARESAARLGIRVVGDVAEVPDGFATAVISNHALEHAGSPLTVLESLMPKVQPGGTLVFVVPHQSPRERWRDGDRNQHLYTWNPMTLGNLFIRAGYSIKKVDVIRHRWPPGPQLWARLGPRLFDLMCRAEAYRTHDYQIRAVAIRPS